MSTLPAVPVTSTAAVGVADAGAILDRAIDRFIAARHARVDAFVDANYSLTGALDLHRHAIGADLLRAPANVALVGPYLAAQLGAEGLKRLGAKDTARWLKDRRIFLDTDVARELAWRLHAQLLELPYDDGQRRCERDALAQELLADAGLAATFGQLAAILERCRTDADLRRRMDGLMTTYLGTRSAAAELVNNMMMAGIGAAAFKQLTPGALSLGSVLAGAIAHHAAITGFPLGAGIGAMWHGLFPAAPSALLVGGVTGGLLGVAAVLTAFAGIASDPLQRALGVHQRRLHRLIDALGTTLKGESEPIFRVRDHYIARIADLIDLARAASQLLR